MCPPPIIDLPRLLNKDDNKEENGSRELPYFFARKMGFHALRLDLSKKIIENGNGIKI